MNIALISSFLLSCIAFAVFSYVCLRIIRGLPQSSFRFKKTVPIFPAEKTRNDGSGMVMGVLRRTWLTDSVDSMKVCILCVYVQPVLDDIINGVSAVLVVHVYS